MDEKVMQFRVGVVVLSAGLIAGILVFIFGEGWKSRYSLWMDFETAQGVSVNTPVRKNGILIGRVTNVTLLDRGVRLTIKVDKDIKVYSSEICKIKKSTLIGDSELEFTPGKEPDQGTLLVDGDKVENTRIEKDPFEEITGILDEVDDAIAVMVELGDDVERAMSTFNDETLPIFNSAAASFDEASQNVAQITFLISSAMQGDDGDLRSFFDDIRQLTRSTNLAVSEFQTVMVNVNSVIGDEEIKVDLANALNQLPLLIQQAEQTLVEAEGTLASIRGAADSATANLENLEGVTEPLGQNGEEMIESVHSSLLAVSEMAVQLEAFTQTLNESEGTVGLLLNDPQLYYSFLQAVENIEGITRDVRPIIDDLRIASDKIARDPGQLGVRGALDRSPVGTGPKRLPWTGNY